MGKQPVERRNTSWRISAEAKRLLELLAEKAGTSQSAVFEQAIREKARREQVTLDEEPATSATIGGARREAAAITPEKREAARGRFRQLVEKARAGFADLTPEAIEREVARAVADVRESRRAGHG
jgi:hypothetical protein